MWDDMVVGEVRDVIYCIQGEIRQGKFEVPRCAANWIGGEREEEK